MGAGVLLILFGLIAVYLFTAQSAKGAVEVDPVDMTNLQNWPQYILDFSEAIAFAEGFGVPGALPTVNHNPGDIGGDKSQGYDSDVEGWTVLRSQVNKMFGNTSRIYNSGMSIREVAGHYAEAEQDSWASNVAYYLNNQRTGFYGQVGTDTTLDQIRSKYDVG